MIAVALVVIVGVVAVTCGIVADSNHADTLTFLGLMVKTTAAQIFLAGAICTWALFASLWLLSVGIRRSKERGVELRLLRAVRRPRLSGAAGAVGAVSGTGSAMAADMPDLAGLAPIAGLADGACDHAMSARPSSHSGDVSSAARATESADSADSEPTIDFSELEGFRSFSALDHIHSIAEPGLGRHVESGRFYRAKSRPSPTD
jgi:hypothetical protein